MVSNFLRQVVLSTAIISLCVCGCQKRTRVQPQSPLYADGYTKTIPERPPPRPAPPPRPQQRNAGNPEWFPRTGKISSRWKTVVVHHSATHTGNARTFDRAHREKGWDELGYHFVIGNGTSTGDGVVEVGSRWHTQKHGAHCKTPDNYYNEHGIGICLVGDFTTNKPTPRQMASLRRLVSFLCDQCRIPDYRVTTHGLVTNKTQCPGRNFPLMSLRRSLALGDHSENIAH